ncbi:hypothetical protein [Pseudomonas purpurea]|uniref:hypothetical protein n=1 Tax=Pseudomonas purpurea TaxID=3136737 RepID=UPI003264FC25
MIDGRGDLKVFCQSRPWAAWAFKLGWPAAIIGFFWALTTHVDWLILLTIGVATTYPLLLAIIVDRIVPDTTYRAWFDERGLNLAIGDKHDHAALLSRFIPFEDITHLETVEHYRNLGRMGSTRLRVYTVKMKQPFGTLPHLQISTKQSAESARSVIKRLKQLPAAGHIVAPPLYLIGNPPTGPLEERAERERRLRGEV